MHKTSHLLLLVLIMVSYSCSKKERTTSKPNIILIFTDDQGYADLGVQKTDSFIKTPNIDYLANNGVRFTNGYVTAPQCSPSRAGIMTGRYQQKFGFDDNDKGPLPQSEITIANRLKKLGYATGMVGKWHLDPNHTSTDWLKHTYPKVLKNRKEVIPMELREPYTPASNGFDDYFWGTMKSYLANFDLNGKNFSKAKPLSDERLRIDVQTEAALQFIKNHKNDPFFLYVSYFAPHVPLEANEKYLNRFNEISNNRRKHGLAMMSAIDDGVGQMLSLLQEIQLEEETLIFFISDNGAPLKLSKPDSPITGIPGPEWDGSLNDPWIGEKGMLTEGGIRVPFIMYWKDHLSAGKVYNHPVISLDVAATSVAIAGGKTDSLLDGINLIPFLSDSTEIEPKRNLYWRFWQQTAIRSGQWKYLKLSNGDEYLFDLTSEDHEYVDMAAKHKDIVENMKTELMTWSNQLKQPGLPQEILSPQENQWYQYHLKLRPSASSTAPHTFQ